MGTEQLDAEVVETVVALYGYFDALLSSLGRRRRVPPGHRASYLLWGSTRQQTRHQACYLTGLGWRGLRR